MISDISISHQTAIFLYSLIFGVAFGIIYDIIRIVRVLFSVNSYTEKGRQLKNRKLPVRLMSDQGGKIFTFIFVFITDLIYFLFAGVSFSVFCFHANSGHVRWYLLLGMLLGFTAYYFTVAKLVMSVSEFVAFYIRLAAAYMILAVLLPFKIIYKLIWFAVRPVKRMVDRFIGLKRTKRIERELIKEILSA